MSESKLRAVCANLLVVVLTPDNRLANLWAADGVGDAQKLCDNLRPCWPDDFRIEVMTPGRLVAAQLTMVADELNRLVKADKDGKSCSPYGEQESGRQAVAACAGTVMHHAERWGRWHA